jgi:hypothetical protein
MFAVASVLAARIPAIAIAANGGVISRREVGAAVRWSLARWPSLVMLCPAATVAGGVAQVLNCARHKIPVVVVEGSGRFADQVRSVYVLTLSPPLRTLTHVRASARATENRRRVVASL